MRVKPGSYMIQLNSKRIISHESSRNLRCATTCSVSGDTVSPENSLPAQSVAAKTRIPSTKLTAHVVEASELRIWRARFNGMYV